MSEPLNGRKISIKIHTTEQLQADKIVKDISNFVIGLGYTDSDVITYRDVTSRFHSPLEKEECLREDIELDKIALVILPSLSHIGRRLKELNSFMELCKTHSVQCISLAEKIDSDESAFKFRLEDIISYLVERRAMDTRLSLVQSTKKIGRKLGVKDSPRCKRQKLKRARLERKLFALKHREKLDSSQIHDESILKEATISVRKVEAKV